MIHDIEAGDGTKAGRSPAWVIRLYCGFGGVPVLLLVFVFAPVARWAMILSCMPS